MYDFPPIDCTHAFPHRSRCALSRTSVSGVTTSSKGQRACFPKIQSLQHPWVSRDVIFSPSTMPLDDNSQTPVSLVWPKQQCQVSRLVGLLCDLAAEACGSGGLSSRMYIVPLPLPDMNGCPFRLWNITFPPPNVAEYPTRSRWPMETRLCWSVGV